MTVAEVLREAADYIANNGWIQGNSYRGGSCCTIGALCAVACTADESGDAQTALARHLKIAPCNLVRWNDAPGRTAAEVIAALRAAAEGATP